MDKYEIRRLNLRALIRSHCEGRAATLADLIGRSPSYLSRMLYPEGRDGKKRIGEDMRDIIEDALSLERGTLDQETFTTVTDIHNEPAAKPVDATKKEKSVKAEPTLASTETTLERLDGSEKSIIELYRRATDKGRTVIYTAAVAAPKTDD